MGIRIHILVFVPFIVLATIGLLLLLRRRGYPASRLLFIAVFAAYLTGVTSFVFFPITLDPDFIEAMRRNATLEQGINLVPFRDLSAEGSGRRQLVGNVLVGIPFGFGLPFVIHRSTPSLLAWGIAFALSIELIQFLMNVVYGFAYRVVDINDFMLNFLGVVLGLAAFRLTSAMYRRLGPADRSGGGSYLHRVLST
ncbi:MAG: VanZ family protein [Chloroflexota bacterium]|nr:VanZ family protein [Chloroflexota bacterium]